MVPRLLLAAALAGAAFLSSGAQAEENVLVLFLSKSSGFEHSCIKQENGNPSHVDKVLEGISARMGAKVTSTKDASLINAENLKNYEVVIFYTTEDLSIEGSDKNPPMAKTGVEELLAWIRAGGGFLGYHCASDTFHRREPTPESPYLDMLGGEFINHGTQFLGNLKVVDQDHPTMANVPQGWEIRDEWYVLTNYMKDKMHVLALLDPSGHLRTENPLDEEGKKRQADMYSMPSYPVIWCSTEGEGRVYYNAMGHREDVWDNPTFQQTVIDAIHWARGEGPADAEPNYSEVVPDAVDISETSVAKN